MDNPSNSQEVVDEVVKTWVDTTRTPTIIGGNLFEDDNFIKIGSQWSVLDLSKKEAIRYERNYTILKSSVKWGDGESVIDDQKVIMSSTGAVPFDGKKICLSKDGSRKAILLEKVEKTTNQKTQILEIWNEETLLKSYNLTELDKHKSVYITGDFGNTMAWSKSSKKLAYIAEKKVPKPKPFVSSDAKMDTTDSDSKDTEEKRGEEFALRQTWGEQMQDMYFSVIVILDLETDKFKVLEMPEDEFPTDLQWVGEESIVGTSYKIPVWRLGLIYCTNKESRIFQIGIDGNNLRFLSKDGRAAVGPRIRPDLKYVVWHERAVDGPHRRAMSIMGMELNDIKTGSPKCVYESVPPNLPIYENFPKSCWKDDGSSFMILTPKDGIMALLEMSFDNDKITKVTTVSEISPSIDALLWIGENYILVARSSILSPPALELIETGGGHKRISLCNKSQFSTKQLSSFHVEKFTGKASIPSFYVGPELSSVKPSSVPLVVWPHGGPHAYFLDSYMHESAFLMRLGFAILKVNYIGSTGSKKDETDELLGKIGSLDVNDCQNIAENVLKAVPCLDSSKVAVFGGSHGGFLSAQLSGQFPDFYKAAVMRNPVCDLSIMIGISDITDWIYAEAGLESKVNTFLPTGNSLEDVKKLHEMSPIIHASKVKAATLLLLGSEDLRVPMSQGLGYYRALKAFGKAHTEVRVYPDCHPLQTVQVRTDNMIHGALWLKRFLK